MKTSIFETKEDYLKMIAAWKQNCSFKDEEGKTIQNKISYIDFALYSLLRGKDWRKCLAPNTKANIIYDIEFSLFKRDPKYISLIMFNGIITPEDITKLREIGIKKWSEV